MSKFFSDREGVPRPRLYDALPEGAWKGIVASFNRALDRNLFAEDFPEQCPDGEGVSGTSRATMADSIQGLIPELVGFPEPSVQPGTDVAMDLVEFAWRHASAAEMRDHHSFFRHDHLTFDRTKGRKEWGDEINLILQRQGVRLEIDAQGRVTRLGSAPAQVLTEQALPPSGDAKLDALVATAIGKYQNRHPQTRRESLEQLWDALERVKTVLNPDKKKGVSALVQRMAASEETQTLITEEFRVLTAIGNDYEIRHHEADKHQVPDVMIDYLFVRALALVDAAVRAISPLSKSEQM